MHAKVSPASTGTCSAGGAVSPWTAATAGPIRARLSLAHAVHKASHAACSRPHLAQAAASADTAPSPGPRAPMPLNTHRPERAAVTVCHVVGASRGGWHNTNYPSATVDSFRRRPSSPCPNPPPSPPSPPRGSPPLSMSRPLSPRLDTSRLSPLSTATQAVEEPRTTVRSYARSRMSCGQERTAGKDVLNANQLYNIGFQRWTTHVVGARVPVGGAPSRRRTGTSPWPERHAANSRPSHKSSPVPQAGQRPSPVLHDP